MSKRTVPDSRPRCTRCNRALENPFYALGLPWGSECKQHVAMLDTALTASGLQFPITLELEPNAAGDGWRYSDEYRTLVNTAIDHHLPIRQDMRFEVVPPTVTIQLKQPSRANWDSLERASRRREQFAASLHGAGAA